jgi:hypothetical protein
VVSLTLSRDTAKIEIDMDDLSERTEARPKKLRSGEWGCTVDGTATPGEIVTIRTNRGKSWPAVIDKVIWSNDKTSICTTREREDADKEREQRESPVPADATPPARSPTRSTASSTRDQDTQGELAAPPPPQVEDADFDAMAEAEASAQSERAAEQDDMMDMAHSFSRDF